MLGHVSTKEVKPGHWLVTQWVKRPEKNTEIKSEIMRRIVAEFYGPDAEQNAKEFAEWTREKSK